MSIALGENIASTDKSSSFMSINKNNEITEVALVTFDVSYIALSPKQLLDKMLYNCILVVATKLASDSGEKLEDVLNEFLKEYNLVL